MKELIIINFVISIIIIIMMLYKLFKFEDYENAIIHSLILILSFISLLMSGAQLDKIKIRNCHIKYFEINENGVHSKDSVLVINGEDFYFIK